jgi:cleavage and polyadenylation specificity factor subunit 1
MQLFGRDQMNLDVVAAEFLPQGRQLFIIAADGDGTLHVLQYDPENPKSVRGTKLLHRSSFHSGAFPTTMTLLPRTAVSSEAPVSTPPPGPGAAVEPATQQILVTTQEGGLALITPLSEQSYRRLSTLQNILTANLEHPCGLNPRAHRAVESDGIGGRAIIDGNVVQKWLDQSSQHKSLTADKCGGSVWEVRGDLEAVGGGGLQFL